MQRLRTAGRDCRRNSTPEGGMSGGIFRTYFYQRLRQAAIDEAVSRVSKRRNLRDMIKPHWASLEHLGTYKIATLCGHFEFCSPCRISAAEIRTEFLNVMESA